MSEEGAAAGIGFGSVVAAIISWSANHSIGWVIVHGMLGWLYVLYYAITY